MSSISPQTGLVRQFIQPSLPVYDPTPGGWNSLTDPRLQGISGWWRKRPGIPPPNMNPYTASSPPIVVDRQLDGLFAYIQYSNDTETPSDQQ